MDDPERLNQELQAIINHPDFVSDHSGGWVDIVRQIGPEYVWEWLIMDPKAPWAMLWTDKQRYRVAQAIANTYVRWI